MGAKGCAIWAVIQDPRTGTHWLQGPATTADATWMLTLALAADDTTGEPFPYVVSIAAVDDETSTAWLSEAQASGGMLSREAEGASAWLARGISLDAAR
jgi:hypothetical protein